MTTIAYRDGVLAADTLVSMNGTVVSHMAKIFRVNDWLIGGSGSAGVSFPIARWVEQSGGDARVPIEWGDVKDSSGLLISPLGAVFHADTGSNAVMLMDAPYHAIGSGTDIALSAMACSRKAVEAVKIAIKLDLYSGGNVTWLSLDGRDSLKLPKRL